jgi:SOS response regulatory protein OraA/RecX
MPPIPGAAKFGRFFGSAASTGAGFAIGVATAPTLDPILQEISNAAWSLHPDKPIDVITLANGVAQGQIPHDWAVDEARRTGFNGERFASIVTAATVGPGVAQAFRLWRRAEISEAGFRRALVRAGIEQEWIDALVKTKDELLDPGQLAAAIHRGLIPDPGLLKGEQPTGPRNVESYPVYPVRPLDEAAASGYDRDRLGVLVGLQGLPMGPHEAAQALFRGIITHGDYIAAFNESNSRNEWAQAVLEQSRQIPTARDFFENALRGYHDFDWALDQAKRHGMSEEDATVIYQNQGRPMAIKQITQALSRGGKFKPEPGEITDPYMASIVEGNVKPGYYDLALSLKYTLPSPFVMRQLTASGVWTEAKAAKRLKDSGWLPEDADEAAKAWAEPAAAKADTHVGKAQTQLWTTLHTAFMAGDVSEAKLTEKLPQAGVSAATVPKVIATWKHEREIQRQRLTAAQVKKAYTKAVLNRATGEKWTRDDALAELIERGWSRDDANTFLDE